MSMHLTSPALSTTRTGRRRKKMTQGQLTRLNQQWREHNQFLKRMKMEQMTFDQFVDHVQGKSTPKKFKAAKLVAAPADGFVSSKQKYPSLNLDATQLGNAGARKPENVYTGDRLIGIAVMHKSCLVPVFSREDAVEISKMRRG